MKHTVLVVYDGEVLRPVEPLDLEPDRAYAVTIDASNGAVEARHPEDPSADEYPLRGFLDLPAIDTGIEDFAEQHDHYLHGTPKR